MSTYITTYTGRRFHFDRAPTIDMIGVLDICHALANLCRFAGHSREFYSVAEHSVHVANHVPDEHRLAALLHDATEAYIVDMPQPLKQRFALMNYRNLEDEIARCIERRFHLAPHALEHPIVKEADVRMLATEGRDLLTLLPGEGCGPGTPYDDTHIQFPLLPHMAEEAFSRELRRALMTADPRLEPAPCP